MSKQKEKLFLVSTIFDESRISSILVEKVYSFFQNDYDIILFTPERNSFIDNTDYPKYNILRLAEYCKNYSDYTLIYFIENHRDFRLISWFSKLYPGLIYLNDLSLFNLDLAGLEHGSVETEINNRFKKVYGNSAIEVGTQYINKRSIDIYQFFYDFIDSSIGPECKIIVPSELQSKWLRSKNIKHSVIKFKYVNHDVVPQNQNINNKILLRIAGKNSKIGLEFFDYGSDHFIITTKEGKIYEISELQLNYPLRNIRQFFLDKGIFAYIESGNSFLSGPSSFEIVARELGIVSISQSTLFSMSTENCDEYNELSISDDLSSVVRNLLKINDSKFRTIDFDDITQQLNIIISKYKSELQSSISTALITQDKYLELIQSNILSKINSNVSPESDDFLCKAIDQYSNRFLVLSKES